MVSVNFRLKKCAGNLAKWNQVNRRGLHRDIELKKKELLDISKDIREGSWREVRRVDN